MSSVPANVSLPVSLDRTRVTEAMAQDTGALFVVCLTWFVANHVNLSVQGCVSLCDSRYTTEARPTHFCSLSVILLNTYPL